MYNAVLCFVFFMALRDKNMLLESFVRGRENDLVRRYIKDGPTVLKGELGLSDLQWKVIFDYLVFNCGLLDKVVIAGVDFFMDGYVKYGFSFVRNILNVEGNEYGEVCRRLFYLLAIEKGGLRYHVIENRDAYMTALDRRDAGFVRVILGLSGERYDEQWEEVLNLLLTGFCEDVFKESNLENGVKFFCNLINSTREHRALGKFKFL